MKFITDIHPLWLILILIVSIGLSFFYYQNSESFSETSPWIKRTLISLRSLSIFIISSLIIGLIIEIIGYRYEKPLVISIIDNSESIRNYKNSNEEINRIYAFNEKLKNVNSEKYDNITYTI
jgi:hypothetical protein